MRDITRRPSLLASPSAFVGALVCALFLGIVTSLVTPDVALGASSTKIAACATGLRTRASTAATTKRTIDAGVRVSVDARVTGASWRVTCAGTWVSGRTWYRIYAIDGRSVKSRYGVTYLYAPSSRFNDYPSYTRYARCSGVNVRTGPGVGSTKLGSVTSATKVSVVATIPGGSWSGSCGGSVAGSSWYRIKAINGTSVRRLFGVSYVYAGSGLFSSSVPASRITEGIDVSRWQGTIDWKKVWLAGKRFAFIKASQRHDYADPTYSQNRSGAKAVGMKVGAYHFAEPGKVGSDPAPDARGEADNFVNVAQIATGEIRPVLDLEQSGGLTVPELVTWVKTYLARVYSRTGVKGIIYVSPAFWTKYMGDTNWFATNGYEVLWIAHWTTAPSPTLPATNWGNKGWTFWQYKVADAGTVPGISTRIDLDRYNGTDFSKVLIR